MVSSRKAKTDFEKYFFKLMNYAVLTESSSCSS